MRLTASPAPTVAARCPVADGAPRLQRITDYPALLAEAWAQAHAPRAANAPTVISTFQLASKAVVFKGHHDVALDPSGVEDFERILIQMRKIVPMTF